MFLSLHRRGAAWLGLPRYKRGGEGQCRRDESRPKRPRYDASNRAKLRWSKFGMESDATWWLESPNGQEIGGSGLSATLRDYGRFGLFFMNGGVVKGEKVLPESWITDAGSSKMIAGKNVNYGYMWWIPDASANPVHGGALLARGIFGQFIYLNPVERIVVVVWSARPKPTGTDTVNDEDLFAAVMNALH